MAVERVVVMGLGRIGLPTAACLAEVGFDVLGVDIDKERLNDIREGKVDPAEPGLGELVRDSLGSGRLRLSTEPEEADAFLLCLPTPLSDDKTCEMKYIESVLGSIAPLLSPGNLVILESTVPVHTTRDYVVPRLKSMGADVGSIHVAYAPERIMSGKMLDEIRDDDRVVGGITQEAAEAARDLYKTFVNGQILLTDTSTAELAKLIENTYRDVNIAFANEMALFCDREGIDAWQAIQLANRHPRVNIHRPGPGVGGHCIPIVPHFIAQGTKHRMMIESARTVNDAMPRYVTNLILRAVSGTQRPRITLMGVAYKPNSSDPVNSPALQIMELLNREDIEVLLCDPLVHRPDLKMVDLPEALRSDCLVFLMGHDVFKELDPRNPHRGRGTVIDFANCLDLARWSSKGWNVRGFAMGRTRA